MSITKYIATGLAVAMIGGAAIAQEGKIYPYASSENYCPDGLQPITISGVICCGTPNTSQSYQSVMAHPVKKAKKVYKKRAVRVSRAVDTCPEGVKGCY